MKKLSIAEVKRKLPVGTEYTAEFIGKINTRNVSQRILRRRVLKHGNEMVSLLLDGPHQGEEIALSWKDTTAEEDDLGIIFLTRINAETYLKIWLPTSPATEINLPTTIVVKENEEISEQDLRFLQSVSDRRGEITATQFE